jgi:hypothetical protein
MPICKNYSRSFRPIGKTIGNRKHFSVPDKKLEVFGRTRFDGSYQAPFDQFAYSAGGHNAIFIIPARKSEPTPIARWNSLPRTVMYRFSGA